MGKEDGAQHRKRDRASAKAGDPPVLAAPSGGQPEGRYDREDKTKPWRLSVKTTGMVSKYR